MVATASPANSDKTLRISCKLKRLNKAKEEHNINK